MNDCKNCVYIDTLSKRVAELEKDVERVKQDIIEIKEINAENRANFKRIFDEIAQIRRAVEKIAEKIDEIEKRPAKNWDVIVAALLSSAAAFFLSQILEMSIIDKK
ncbi:hypothetical protein [Caloramator australicus]|uniref:Uncharacterized protein n=1 Tax=Caloramator australicus RC3 TaxID=857293 RepID=I7LIF7_9CLOT|nr:hypothetical protein [Caloramator australicus]CCJ32907.1 hypothetical protein CAAU_0823 [Caloramator australicus RC3]